MAYPSAVELISPAIERTKQFLFRPFRLGRFLKLTLVAALVEGGSGGGFSGNFPTGTGHGGNSAPKPIPQHGLPPFHFPHFDWSLLHIGILVGVALLIVIPVMVLLGYLLIRLRFTYFDCVLKRHDQIGAGWSLYHRQALRYLGLTWLIGLAFWVVLIPIGWALFVNYKPLFVALGTDHAPGFAAFLPLIGIVLLLFMVLALVGFLVEAALGCFVLPRMALEDASISGALSDVWDDFRRETGQFLLFVLFRFLTSLAASILGGIVLIVPFIVVVLIGVAIVLAAKAASIAAAFVVGIPLGIIVVGCFVLAGIGVGGTVGTFRRNYALLFYAGRYPLLGAILYPPLPPTVPVAPWQPGFVPPNPATGI